MSFEREKRLLLGWLALLAPIPLPFNQVLEWPLLFLYSLAVIVFLQRADTGRVVQLPNWALNLLGLIYLPIFATDIRLAIVRNSPVRALLHLILFLVVVKLFSLRKEQEKWHLLVAIYFIFIGAMATSSHVTIGLYLLAFLVASSLALGRLAQLHMVARFGQDHTLHPQNSGTRTLPYRAPLLLGMLAVIFVSIPLFATMPRFREPFVLGTGTGIAGIGRTTGFSDSVDLSLTTSIRGNRNVVARVQYESTVDSPGDLRFKGATFDLYRNNRWFRLPQQAVRLQPTEERVFQLARTPEEGAIQHADMFLEPIGSNAMILPSEAIGLEMDFFPVIDVDPGGAVLLPVVRRRDTLRYRVHLANRPTIAARLAPDPTHELAALDVRELSPRITELASQVMGEGTAEERTDRLEQHLLTQYAYTTDLLGRTGANPLEDFLFEYRSGHCEFFASSMVLMLRSQGIPARYVTGFLGAEYNPLQDYFILRQGSAHAWVEAFTPDRGWQIYDPTPPEGRPVLAARGLRLFLTQVVDFITFRWDRYVLTYGADDQKSFFEDVKSFFTEWWEGFRDVFSKDEELELESSPGVAIDREFEKRQGEPAWQKPGFRILFAMALLSLTALAWLFWQRYRSFDGQTAYLRLRTRLVAFGLDLPDSLPPLEVERRAVTHLPDLEGPIHRIVRHYLQENFAEEPLSETEIQELRRDWASVHKTLRKPPAKAHAPLITAPTS